MTDLVILACNPGAKTGDYLTGALWKRFYPPLKDQTKFVAVDSIITTFNNDGQGALIPYPEEMYRVKGFDVKANLEMYNPTKKIGLQRLENLTESLKVGIDRIFPKYERIFIALNLEVYKMCMYAAITEKEQWHKVIFYEMLAAAWNQTFILQKLRTDVISKNFKTGLIRLPERADIEQTNTF